MQKNPGIAAVLSFFITGLGQIYNGQFKKAAIFFGVMLINVLLCYIVIGFITGPITWAYGIYDAYKSAEEINRTAEENRTIDAEIIKN